MNTAILEAQHYRLFCLQIHSTTLPFPEVYEEEFSLKIIQQQFFFTG